MSDFQYQNNIKSSISIVLFGCLAFEIFETNNSIQHFNSLQIELKTLSMLAGLIKAIKPIQITIGLSVLEIKEETTTK